MKIIYFIFIASIILFAENNSSILLKNKIEYTKNPLLAKFNGDFTKIIDYNNKLFQHNNKKELFDFNIKLINTMVDKYGEDNEYVYISYLFLARYYILDSEYDIAKSLISFIEEIKENKKFENSEVIQYIIYMTKASYAEGVEDFNNSYSLYLKAYKLNKKLYKNNPEARLHVLNPLSRVALLLSKIIESEKYIKEAMSIEKNDTNLDSLCLSLDTFINYANIYKSIEDYKKTLIIYKTAETLYDGTKKIYNIKDDFPCIIEFYTEYANFLVTIGQYSEGIKISTKALSILKKLKIINAILEINNLSTIAYAQKESGQYKEAKKSYTKALKIMDTIKNRQKIKYKKMIAESIKRINNLQKTSNK